MSKTLKIMALLAGGCICSGVALADETYKLNFDRFSGHFSCDVDADDNAEVIIDTSGVTVKGPSCDGHAIHTTAKDLKQFAYSWERKRVGGVSAIITVKGSKVKNLSCKDDRAGRPEAPGGDC